MDLETRYGLEFNPFLKNSKEILFQGKEYREALFRLNYLSRTRGFGVLTGSPGRGKTTTVRNWSAELSPALFKVAYTSLSTVAVNEFYRNLASTLGVEPAYHKTKNFRAIQDEVTRLAVDKKKTPVIIIDEASHVCKEILDDLKILFNFEMDSCDRAVVLLVGLPKLNHTLQLSVHEPLRQRIVMNYNLEGYSKEEGREYIAKKLGGAGCSQTVFEDDAVEAILNAADGTARMINKLCSAALVLGNSREIPVIHAETAMQAISDCELE